MSVVIKAIGTEVRAKRHGVASPRLAVYGGCVLLALTSNYFAGKDMPWDAADYQLYAGFSALHDRFAQDYFAAGLQSYLNPYVYVPFYALVSSGMPALLMCSILAMVQSVVLWLVYEIALCACPSDRPTYRLKFGLCAVALAYVNPILIQQIGSSFVDVLTGEVALAGWLLLAMVVARPEMGKLVGAALLLGAATALKLTNAVHAVAACVLLLFVPGEVRAKLRLGSVYAVTSGVAFAAIAAPWAFRLERMFGSPLFPLFNNMFRSPVVPVHPIIAYRFIPASLWQALWRPFAMMNPVPMVQTEDRAPDVRYAVLLIVAVLLAVRALWRLQKKNRSTERSSTGGDFAIGYRATRVLIALACGLGLDWILWLSTSGNGRYFVAISCIAAVVLTGLLFGCLRPKVRNYVLLALFAAQGMQLWSGTDFRWSSVPWGGPWIKVTLPSKLADEPNFYLTIGSESSSFLAPYLARGSGMVDFSGGYALGPEGPSGARIKGLLARYSPHLRMLAEARLYGANELPAPIRAPVDGALARFGLQVDPNDCLRIRVDGMPHPFWFTVKGRKQEPQPANTSYFVSCGVVSAPTRQSAELAALRMPDIVLDRLERACPAVFQPDGLRTDDDGLFWVRRYMNTDVMAMVYRGTVQFSDVAHHLPPRSLGHVRDWLASPPHMTCGRRADGQYFAELDGTSGTDGGVQVRPQRAS